VTCRAIKTRGLSMPAKSFPPKINSTTTREKSRVKPPKPIGRLINGHRLERISSFFYSARARVK